jgi:hypothetical protein
VCLRNAAGVLEGAGSVRLGGLEVAVPKRRVAQPKAKLEAWGDVVLVEPSARRHIN